MLPFLSHQQFAPNCWNCVIMSGLASDVFSKLKLKPHVNVSVSFRGRRVRIIFQPQKAITRERNNKTWVEN